jgi:hypothetical protein
MQTQRASQNKGPKYLDTKVLIASLSIAVTVGLWNLFSNEAVLANQTDETTGQNPSQTPASEGQDLPPLPTLVPPVDLSKVQGSESPTVVLQSQDQPVGLRSVTAPDQVIVQKVKPVIEDDKPTFTSSGGGSSNQSPVTQTRSSGK